MKKLALLILLACLSHFANAQSYAPLLTSHQQFFDASGNPLAGGQLFFYAAGTSTPQDTYTNCTDAVANTNPVVLDASGFGDICLSANTYKVVAKDASGVTQWTVDHVQGAYTTFTGIFISSTASPATSGAIRLANLDVVNYRDHANSVNLTALAFDTSTTDGTTDALILGNTNGVLLSSGSLSSVLGTNLSVSAPRAQVNPAPGGDLSLAAALGGAGGVATGGNGGSVVITAGGASTSGGHPGPYDGGSVTITAGAGGGSGSNGGSIVLNTGGGTTAGTIQTNSTIGVYDGIATAGNGIPAIRGVANQTAQAANIAGTNAYSVTVSGLYRVSVYVVVTQAATTSSTMPSSAIAWTDADSSGPASVTATATNTGNTTSTFAQGPVIVNAKAGTNINYSTSGYASSGATPMQYAIHIRVEAL